MKSKSTFLALSFLVVLLCCSKIDAQAQSASSSSVAKDTWFKVIGYLFTHGDFDTASTKLDLTKITHLNVAFINPDSTGNFNVPLGLAAVIKRAHDNRVKVMLSIAGGMPPVYLKDLLKADQRTALVHHLVDFAVLQGFDGVDVDLEGDFIDENYEPFILELASILKPQQKLMSAAVNTGTGNKMSDQALAQFDLINIMSYDQTGPWNRELAGPHSTYETAVLDFNYWNVTRAIPASRLTLGLPFYGYGFGPDIKPSYDYSEIVYLYPGSEKKDLIDVPDKGTIYYNGLKTIKKKVKFALDRKAGGVMIWQLRGDVDGKNSLLSAIHNTIKKR
jgi:chitinase